MSSVYYKWVLWTPQSEDNDLFDPSTTARVRWADGGSNTTLPVHWGTSSTSLTNISYSTSVASNPGGFTGWTSLSINRFHTVKLTNLVPDTTYYFLIDGDTDTIPRKFRTAPAKGSSSSISFAQTSDSQIGSTTERRKTWSAAASLEPRFQLCIGDTVDQGHTPSLWNSLLNDLCNGSGANSGRAETPDGYFLPLITSYGNHETYGSNVDSYPLVMTDLYYYSVQIGNILCIILPQDEGPPAGITANTPSLLSWLETKLIAARADSSIKWIFPLYHKSAIPTYYSFTTISSPAHDYYERTYWWTLFEKYGVTACLTGHDHTPKISKPIVDCSTIAENVDTSVSDILGIRESTTLPGGGSLRSGAHSLAWRDATKLNYTATFDGKAAWNNNGFAFWEIDNSALTYQATHYWNYNNIEIGSVSAPQRNSGYLKFVKNASAGQFVNIPDDPKLRFGDIDPITLWGFCRWAGSTGIDSQQILISKQNVNPSGTDYANYVAYISDTDGSLGFYFKDYTGTFTNLIKTNPTLYPADIIPVNTDIFWAISFSPADTWADCEVDFFIGTVGGIIYQIPKNRLSVIDGGFSFRMTEDTSPVRIGALARTIPTNGEGFWFNGWIGPTGVMKATRWFNNFLCPGWEDIFHFVYDQTTVFQYYWTSIATDGSSVTEEDATGKFTATLSTGSGISSTILPYSSASRGFAAFLYGDPTPQTSFVPTPYLWALTVNEVLYSKDSTHWFTTSGLNGIQYVQDINQDFAGNMYVTTDLGVYFFDISTITNFPTWSQTSLINAFSSQSYGIYVTDDLEDAYTPPSTIFVSTEVGIYLTVDQGNSWTFTGMLTEGLPVYSFIQSSRNYPTVIGATKKHILKKKSNDADFYVVTDFEAEYGLSNIWKIEYFNYLLYVSTEDGVYISNDDIFHHDTLTFTKILPELNIKGHTVPAYGLNKIQSNTLEYQLFVGTENKLILVDSNNRVSVKRGFNKDIPSFFVDDEFINIGYVYNTFNNTLSFREAVGVNQVVSASYIPRTTYTSSSWTFQNPLAEIFVYFDGHPVWVDFSFDSTNFLTNLDTISAQLTAIQPTLSDFNSLYPLSLTVLTLVQTNIATIKKDYIDNISDSQKSTDIATFYNNYSYFISLCYSSFVTANSLSLPNFTLNGVSPSQRKTGSKAQLLSDLGLLVDQNIVLGNTDDTSQTFVLSSQELSNNINTDTTVYLGDMPNSASATGSSVGVSIDAKTGEVTFPIAFNKYDNLQITVFNGMVKNTGLFRHTDLEDQMEMNNTGLTSNLASTVYANLIKLGIGMEWKHPGFLDTVPTTNVQAKYYAAHTQDWYDTDNSTIDYETIATTPTIEQPKFTTCIADFVYDDCPYEDPYDPYYYCNINKIWVGTDANIHQYTLDLDSLVLEKVIFPNNEVLNWYIWDICVNQPTEIYVVASKGLNSESKIFLTTDKGSTWSVFKTTNLPSRIYKLNIIRNTKTATTESGIYYCDNNYGYWYASDVVPSSVMSSNDPSLTQFKEKVMSLEKDNILIAESDRYFYRSGGGTEWISIGRISTNYITVVNRFIRFKNLTWIATDKGLYNDSNTVMSDSIGLGLQLLASTATLAQKPINDISYIGSTLYAGGDDGYLYRYTTTANTHLWEKCLLSNISTIHHLHAYGLYLIVFCFGLIKVISPDDQTWIEV